MSRKRVTATKAVKWLSGEIIPEQKICNSFCYYQKFQFENIVCELGDFVLVSNADSAEPDTEAGCDAARVLALYEDRSNNTAPFRAKVQWYSRPSDVPSSCLTNKEPFEFFEREVLEDHRPFDTDVDIETFFKKCSITLTFTKDTDLYVNTPFHYLCRYRLMPVTKRKMLIEPVLEQEREAIKLLRTPAKTPLQNTPKTPSSITKRLSRISLSDQRNWSVSKNDGTKLLLKRAILADKSEKSSPRKVTPNVSPRKTSESSRNQKVLTKNKIEELLSAELYEPSDEDELPTLIIRQHVPNTPKRKSKANDRTPKKLAMELIENSNEDDLPTLVIRDGVPVTPKRISKAREQTPNNSLLSLDNESKQFSTRSGRITRNPVSYNELSPVKRTPKKFIRKVSESNEDKEKLPTLIIREGVPVTSKRRSIHEGTPNNYLSTLDDESKKTSRSGRIIRNPVSYNELSPVKRTPRKSLRKVSECSDDEFMPLPKTPKTPRTPRNTRTPRTLRTPRMTPGNTPKSVKRRIMVSELTPTLQARAHPVHNVNDFSEKSQSLPGREQELDEIMSFVRTKLIDGSSGCMYISGVPGTGKTATVCLALNLLKEEVDLPEFQLVEVNGMRIAEPRQAYVQIYKQLTGKTVVWEQACSLLEKRFTNPGPRRTPTVLLVDELDALCTRRQDVLYSIVEWATHAAARLAVLAVANTMDLPERALAARVASRLGLTRLAFAPYSHAQLQCIVTARLAGARVSPDALQLIARKVAAVSGDARRALSLCARAAELAGKERAGLEHVQRALAEAASGVAVRAVQSCAPAEKLMLRAVAAEVERTGSDETTLSRALSTAGAIVALDGRPYRSAPHVRAPTPSQALAICARLSAMRLLLLEQKPAEPRLLLNVSVDDIHYGTRQMTV